jgi:galactokinase
MLIGRASYCPENSVTNAPLRLDESIGEHTDYNLGFVLPIALDLACVATTVPASRSATSAMENRAEEKEWT